MTASLRIEVSKKLYLKNPLDTELGYKIVTEGLQLIDKIGFENFTFKKLATKIKSTEASVYRYFTCKLQFLNYLVSWYWHWVDYIIEIRTTNITDPKKRLEIAIVALLESASEDPFVTHIDETALYRIITREGARIYLTKQNEKTAAKDIFSGYDLLFTKIHKILTEVNPKYKHPRSLARGIIALAHKQAFDMEFLDGTSAGVLSKGAELKIQMRDFLFHLVFATLEVEPTSKK